MMLLHLYYSGFLIIDREMRRGWKDITTKYQLNTKEGTKKGKERRNKKAIKHTEDSKMTIVTSSLPLP